MADRILRERWHTCPFAVATVVFVAARSSLRASNSTYTRQRAIAKFPPEHEKTEDLRSMRRRRSTPGFDHRPVENSAIPLHEIRCTSGRGSGDI